MKKFIALTIGLSLLGAALIVPMSNASREAYHSYLAKKAKETGRYRTSTDRKGNAKQLTSVKRNSFVRSNLHGRNYRTSSLPRGSKRNLHSSFSSNKNLKLRTSTNRLLGTRSTKQNSHRIAISTNRMIDVADFSFENYTNKVFSLEIPAMSTLSDENNKLEITIPRTTVKISAKKLDTKCGKNLSLCARSISRTIDKNDDIYRVSQTVQQYQKTDVILGSVGLDSTKYVEGFIGETTGVQSFIARFITEGQDGDLFLVEASSQLKDIDKTVVFAKKLFESFRAKY